MIRGFRALIEFGIQSFRNFVQKQNLDLLSFSLGIKSGSVEIAAAFLVLPGLLFHLTCLSDACHDADSKTKSSQTGSNADMGNAAIPVGRMHLLLTILPRTTDFLKLYCS